MKSNTHKVHFLSSLLFSTDGKKPVYGGFPESLPYQLLITWSRCVLPYNDGFAGKWALEAWSFCAGGFIRSKFQFLDF